MTLKETDSSENPGASGSPSVVELSNWLIAAIAATLDIPAESIDTREPFASYGLPSREAVIISGDLQEWLGRRLGPTLLYEYSTIEALSAHLAGESSPAGARSESSTPHPGGETRPNREPIAIVGLSCRFPGAPSAEQFWRLLVNGVDAITPVPASRWNVDEFFDPNPATPGKINTRWGGFLEDIDKFDPQFFGMSPREAVYVDPQQRLLLELAWEALEDAGIRATQLSGNPVGVYVGISGNEYGRVFLQNLGEIDVYSGTGNALSIAANRLSYFLDLAGPSMAVDTACSSSLVAVYLACQSLWTGQTTLALAGGANLILTPAVTVNFTKARAMAADGRCKAFDSRADGYVRSEGAGMVVLKPLSTAVADNDDIYAVIRGGAINQDGRTNGLMAPSRKAQEAVILEACRSASVSPAHIQYVETHGTGTILGDAIEARALGEALGKHRTVSEPCLIGSVKTNIGHLEAAAGVAALIKTALSLKHGSIPPSLHYQNPNPEIPFDEMPIRVQTAPGVWTRNKPLLAGVSSFGFGGTNAHLILEGPPPIASQSISEPAFAVLPISARTPEAVAQLTEEYIAFLENSRRPFHQICASAALGREQFDYRVAIAANSAQSAAACLRAHLAGESRPGCSFAQVDRSTPGKLVFVFSGEGSQWLGMGTSLLQSQPTFRRIIERCDALMFQYAQWSLLDELQAGESGKLAEAVEFIQPALFAIQLGLAEIWREWGIYPEAVVGHGMGEVAAACVAGALSIEDAVRVICNRSQLLPIKPGRSTIPFISTVAGAQCDGEALSPEYWARDLRETVLFGPAIERLLEQGATAFLEISPNPILLMSIQQQICQRQIGAGKRAARTFASLRREEAEQFTLLETAGALFSTGYPVAWGNVYPMRSEKVKLPFYPFQRESYWISPASNGNSPVTLTGWDRLRAAGLTSSAQWPFDLKLQAGPARASALDRVSTAAIVNTLRALGSFSHPGETYSPASFIEAFEILPMYEKLVGRWFDRLSGAGYLSVAGTQFSVPRPLPELGMDRLWQEVRERCAGSEVLVAYLERCASRLPQVLTGKVSSLEVMFPGGSFETTDSLYRLSAEARYFNGIAASIAATVAKDWPAGEPLRILEVGAGTGGTTASLLPMLSGAATEYVFTDLTAFFLNKARAEFADYPFVRFELLDIEKDPEEQGFERASFDLVIGANVFHATADLNQTLQHARALLKPSGLLLLWEVTEPLTWFDISFGLIEGWQRYKDDLRTNGPLLSPAKWCEALRAHGFEEVETLPPANSPASALNQHIILAGARNPIPARSRDVFHASSGTPAYSTEVSQYYDELSRNSRLASGDAAYEMYLTFAPLPARVRGFSWLLALYGANSHHEQSRRARDAQRELRQLVLRHVDFTRVQRVLDFGCGYGSDVVSLGIQFPALLIDGYTISGEQAEAGNRKIRDAGLQSRLRIYKNDSVAASFPGRYDLVLGFEVAGHIPDKERLFANISSHLNEGGHLVMADFVANTVSSVSVEETGAYTITVEQWSDLLAQHQLSILDAVNISTEVANFLYDPDFDANLGRITLEHQVDELVLTNLKSYQNIGRILERGLMSYVLLTVEKDGRSPAAELASRNRSRLNSPLSYAAATEQIGHVGRSPALQPASPVLDNLFYELQWTPLTALSDVASPARSAWVLLMDEGGVAEALIARLKEHSVRCIAVFRGEHFAQIGDDAFTLPLAEPEACARLMQFLDSSISGIIHLWPVDFAAAENVTEADATYGLTAGVTTGLILAQSLMTAEHLQSARIWFVTKGAQSVIHSGDQPAVHQSTLWGLGRVIASEYPRQWGGLIDIDPAGVPEDAAARIFSLIRQSSPEHQFAIRRDEIYVPRLARSRAASQQQPILCCRSDGSYLITGGLGVLGLLLARRLAERGARRILLIGRRALPPRIEWGSVPPESTAAAQIRAIRGIEALGASVHVFAADLSNERQIAELLERYEAECWPPIRGVIHAAGLVEGRTVLELDRASLESVLAAKVSGAWNLHRLFRDKPLDFFVLFSSASALLGPPGQGNYAAANAFLDALAIHRRSIGLPAISIDWGAWSEVGAAAKPLVKRIESLGMGSLAIKPALNAFEHVLGLNPAQIAVLLVDWAEWFRAMPSAAESPFLSLLRKERVKGAVSPLQETPERQKIDRQRILSADPEAGIELVENYLAALTGHVLRISPSRLDRGIALSNAGVDSLIAVELKNQIELDLSIVVSMATLLKGPSIRALARDMLRLVEDTQKNLLNEPARPMVCVATNPPPIPVRGPDALDQIGALSDDAMESLLAQLAESEARR